MRKRCSQESTPDACAVHFRPTPSAISVMPLWAISLMSFQVSRFIQIHALDQIDHYNQ